jgi:DNA-binding response OmpR family regulator
MPTAVFLVEDDVRLAELMADALRDDGFEVAVAARPTEAIGRLQSEHADVIVFDLRMDGMDGREFYRAIRAQGVETPAVLVTAWGEGETIARELGVRFLKKPFDLDDLSATVRAAIEPND